MKVDSCEGGKLKLEIDKNFQSFKIYDLICKSELHTNIVLVVVVFNLVHT